MHYDNFTRRDVSTRVCAVRLPSALLDGGPLARPALWSSAPLLGSRWAWLVAEGLAGAEREPASLSGCACSEAVLLVRLPVSVWAVAVELGASLCIPPAAVLSRALSLGAARVLMRSGGEV
jgi:hypothetical protein